MTMTSPAPTTVTDHVLIDLDRAAIRECWIAAQRAASTEVSVDLANRLAGFLAVTALEVDATTPWAFRRGDAARLGHLLLLEADLAADDERFGYPGSLELALIGYELIDGATR